MDKATEILLDALRQGAAIGGELRLYRSGKLPGLFTGKTSINAEIASKAVADGFIEMVRTETKGKTSTDWVRVTPQGIAFLLERESPHRAMDELRAALHAHDDGLPGWLGEIRNCLEELTTRFLDEVAVVSRRLDALAQRVGESLKRTERSQVAAGAAGALIWAEDVSGYLEQRQTGGLGDKCPLPELFAAVKNKDEALTIKDFHIGLRRLHDRGALRLLPFDGPEGPPEPEYALLDGPAMYWFAARCA